jgi:hypothetical protein
MKVVSFGWPSKGEAQRCLANPAHHLPWLLKLPIAVRCLFHYLKEKDSIVWYGSPQRNSFFSASFNCGRQCLLRLFLLVKTTFKKLHRAVATI